MIELDPRSRRALTIIGLLAGLGVLWPALFVPASSARDAALSARELLGTTQLRLVTLRQRAISISDENSVPPSAVFAASSAEESLQNVQIALRDAFTRAGGLVLVSEASQSSLAQGLNKLSVSVRAQMSEPSLMTFIRDVETLEPQIAIDGLDVSAAAGDASGALSVGFAFVAVHRDAK